MSATPSRMVVAAAREMCRQSSEGCGVDNEDNWKCYGSEFLADAAKVLDAAGVPELVIALQSITGPMDAPDDSALTHMDFMVSLHWLRQARAAIRKATGGEQP